jgi:hypothetical protein
MNFNKITSTPVPIPLDGQPNDPDLKRQSSPLWERIVSWWDRQWGGVEEWSNQHRQSKQLEINSLIERVHPHPYLSHLDPLEEEKQIPPHQQEWYIQLGLLMRVYRRTQDEKLKKQICFLALNYLYKVAPICPSDILMSQKALDALLAKVQLGIWNPGVSYNRESDVFDPFFKKSIQSTLAPASGERFFIVDSLDIDELFELYFSYFHSDDKEKLRKFLLQFEKEPPNMREELKPPMLIDCTSVFEPDIYTSGDPEKNTIFEQKLQAFEATMDQWLKQELSSSSEELLAWLKRNMIFICKCRVNNVPLIKVLPIFYDQSNLDLLRLRKDLAPPHFNRFLSHTGLRLGSVVGRQLLAASALSLDELVHACSGQLVQYRREDDHQLYFSHPVELTQKKLFVRLHQLFEGQNGYLSTLGKPTLQLIEGVLKQINDEQWQKAHDDLDKRTLIQASLFRIGVHLGNAEKYKTQFASFAQCMELIHYELISLLTLFEPFLMANFSDLYVQNLAKTIPSNLDGYVKAGLTKSATNTFAAIQAALGNRHQAVYTKGIHFEFSQLLGEQRNFDEVRDKNELEHVDLYLGESSPNISLYANHPNYTSPKLIEEVSLLLQARSPQANPLTVAIDATIDHIRSKKMHDLLHHFSQEILEGKLIFVIFQSQKFWLYGMDHVYGSPFYVIHNQTEVGQKFEKLTKQEAFQTDSLSHQWFCLMNQSISHPDEYRRAIFQNARALLDKVPDSLQHEKKGIIRVARAAPDVETCFIDIKCFGKMSESIALELQQRLYDKFADHEAIVHTRAGYGSFHPNLVKFKQGLDDEPYTTLRITLGIDPKDNEILAEFLLDAAHLAKELEIEHE